MHKFADVPQRNLDQIKLIATDMDGTLTVAGKFPSALGSALWDLQGAGFAVVIVTGRSAGWVSGLAHYLPIQGAIAENGGLFFHKPDQPAKVLSNIPELSKHRAHLAHTFHQLQTQFPHLCTTADNAFRITDWTFENPGFNPSDLDQMAQKCAIEGFDFTYSTVQCHIKPQGQNKQAGLLSVLADRLPYDAHEVLTIGDSPNDQDLFDPQVFPLSVGVANLSDYLEQIKYHPQAITQAPEGKGFMEITRRLLKQ